MPPRPPSGQSDTILHPSMNQSSIAQDRGGSRQLHGFVSVTWPGHVGPVGQSTEKLPQDYRLKC